MAPTRSRYLTWLARDLEAPLAPAEPAKGDFGPDLVIGYATGYGAPQLSPFVRSLRFHSRARIALVASPAEEVRALFAREGVDRFDAPLDPGWAPHLLIARFKHYLSILDAYPQARRVLISDVRDVAFQGDPFARGYPDDEADLALFAESPPGTLGRHGANPAWLDTLVGEGLARRLHHGATVCGGTIIGAPAALKQAIRVLLSLCAIQRSGALNGIGADQAALNVIAHWGLLPCIVAPNYGRTATIGHAEAPTLTEDGRLLNPDGTASPILHQYDRYPFAKAAIEARWIEGGPPPPSGKRKRKDKLARSIGKRLPELR